MEAFKPWKGSGKSLHGPCLPGLGTRSCTEDLGRGGAPHCCSLLPTCQLSTSVLPSSGGKQPVTVGLLWIQQAAFVSPNSEMLQKATEWAGDCFLGREPPVLSTMAGRGNSIYAPGPMPVCALFEMHTYSQTTASTHANTHVHTHVSKSNRSAVR